jgi:protoheme IX farnesyltransferase
VNTLYYQLAKPGIVYGNALTAAAGFVLASQGSIDWLLFFAMLLGISLIVASAAVTNNVFDSDIDALMERTKGRALATGAIQPQNALLFATILGLLGIGALLYTNLLALGIAIFGWIMYVAVYTPLKRQSAYSLFVGAVAGAVPPVVGYVSVTHTLDMTAFALFAFLFVWQVVHFIAIAIYRYDEYTRAGIPLFVSHPPSERARQLARWGFYLSLVILLAWCAALMLQR